MKPIKFSKPQSRRKPHDDLVKAALEYLEVTYRHRPRAYFWPNKQTATQVDGRWLTGTFKGPADILGFVKGLHVELEAKTGSGRLTTEQKEHSAKVSRAGGRYYVFREPQEVVEIVNSILNEE